MGALMMSRKERLRLEVFGRVKRGELTVVKAAAWLGVSERQARRIYRRFRLEKDAGLVHRLRGRRSNRRIDQAVRDRVVARHQARYADFGPTHACEKLASEDGLFVSVDTLGRMLKEAGVWRRTRRGRKHRSRRERRACFGEMVQMDGSPHDWFEGRAPRCVLMDLVDDATGVTVARLFPEETTVAALESFGGWVASHGVPRSLYVDRDSIYRSDREATVEEELAGREPLTQFGRAMGRLGVTLIKAHSPQAKGRVERKNRTFQDRLPKELRLAGIDSIEAANRFLAETFLPELNRRCTVPARDKADAHRRVPRGTKLAEVLCLEEGRSVGQDWCVRYRNRWLQIDRAHERLGLAGKSVTVRELLDGTIRLLHEGRPLRWSELPGRPAKVKAKKRIVNNKAWKPSAKQQPPRFRKAG
jgi:transposase